MNNGFTLIELIVVISLISIILFLSIPRLQNVLVFDSTKKVARRILATVRFLKKTAVADQKRYILHVHLDANRLWITNESMSEAEIQQAEGKSYSLPDGVRISDVEYANKGKISSGTADIHFYKNAYSDYVWIHIENNRNRSLSFLIEPFQSKATLFENYVGFEH
ncbi:MAG: prepilin-type N-terminal cleavage/methylation domain-containing protein [Desulfobacterales bacterium]